MAVEEDAKFVLQAQTLHFYKEQELGYSQKIMLSSLFWNAKARGDATQHPTIITPSMNPLLQAQSTQSPTHRLFYLPDKLNGVSISKQRGLN